MTIPTPYEDLLRDIHPGDMLAVGDGSGAHVFSATYAEHNAAVARYLRQLRGNRAAESQQ